jgi:ADP-heptose:LPS heptosyltransferase
MGDIIQKTPMIRSIREHDVDGTIYLLGDNRWNGLNMVEGSPLIDEVCNVADLLGFKFPKNYNNTVISGLYEEMSRSQKSKLSSWIRDIDWDVFLDSSESDIPPTIARIIEQSSGGRIYRHSDIREKRMGGFMDWWRDKTTKATVELIPIVKGRHDIDSNYDLLEACLEQTLTRRYDTWIDLRFDSRLLTKWGLNERSYICLQPGAANGAPTPKTWHPENFVELSRVLKERYSVDVVLLGDRGDQERIIRRHQWPEGVINTAGETTIEDLGGLVKNSICVVAHDSGIMHLANAMKVPLVALYGPTDYSATQPKGKRSVVLFSRTESFAVMNRSDKSEKILAKEFPDYQSMSGIEVNDVLSVVATIIEAGDISRV